MSKVIRLAHSPDSDDAFMFHALANGKIAQGEYEFIHELHDIETLNQAAFEGKYEVSAISFHAYCHLADRYAILPHGASFGENYGPVIISREPMTPEALKDVEIAIPGLLTTAYLTLRLYLGGEEPKHRVVHFDQIMDEVKKGASPAGLLIHEGQLTYAQHGLTNTLDLGEWWLFETGLPLPLGVNVARRDLGEAVLNELSGVLRESIERGLSSREPALKYALQFGRGLDHGLADRFVGMYVNRLTQDYGDEGRQAVQELLRRGETVGAFPHAVNVEFVGESAAQNPR